MKKILLAILSAPIFLFSCTKETRQGPQAQVKFINGSVNTASAEVSFDGILLVGATGFPEASGYSFVNVGTPSIKVQATASSGTTVLVGGSSSLLSNINYTIVAADSTHKLKLSVITDNVSTPATGKASIRFLHLAGNMPNLRIDTSLLTTAGGVLYSNRTFNDQSTSSSVASFITVNAGTYTFKAKDATTPTTEYISKSITLESNKIYTIAATGAIGATAGTLQVPTFSVFPNN